MPIRKILLRSMFSSLALAAVAGIVTVLTAGNDVVWRVVGTAMLAAAASGLLLIVSLLINKESSRPAGLFGMWSVVIAFLLSLVLIWDYRFTSKDELVGLSLLLVLGAAPPMMFFLRLIYAKRAKQTGIVGFVCCGIGFVLFLGCIWIEVVMVRNWNDTERLAASAWAISALGAIAAGSLVDVGRDRRWWRWIGIIGAAVACAMALIGIWARIERGSVAFAGVTGIAIVVAHANLSFICNLTPGQIWVRWGTIAAMLLTSLFVDLAIALDSFNDVDLITRGAAASAIAAGCGTLTLMVLALLNRKITRQVTFAGAKELAIVCPFCQRKQSLPLGASSCAGCGLKFQITVEEPRCPTCNYLLLMLTSDRCPECGTVVRGQAERLPTTGA